MANYILTTYKEVFGTIELAVDGLETKLETVTNTKVIRLLGIYATADLKFMAVAIYDT